MTGKREQGIKRDGEESAGASKEAGSMVVLHKYTEEEKAFFREYVPGHSRKEIREEFIRRFGWKITMGQTVGCIKRWKLNTGRTGRFEKGQQSHNKGVPMSKEVYEKASKTMFKKGNVPHNHKPVGSERVNVEGYIEIKVEEPRKWRLKQRVIWEQHYGEIPKGHVIIFADGNKLNTDIENLRMISNKEMLTMTRRQLRTKNQELTDTGIGLAKLINATYEAKKRRG